MIVRLITPLNNAAGTLSVIAVDANNNVVIKNIVENVAGTPSDDLKRQLWEFEATSFNNREVATFKNVFTGTYLSCANGTGNNTPLTLEADEKRESSAWVLSKQANLPGDDAGAPRSYAIQTVIDNAQVVDLSWANTQEGSAIITYGWKGSNSGDYNQFWFLEEPRIQINNLLQKGITISASSDDNEVIEVWDTMVGGSLIGAVTGNSVLAVLPGSAELYLSSKRKGANGTKINESENEANQIIDLSNNSSASVQFYYGDPKRGAVVTISVSDV